MSGKELALLERITVVKGMMGGRPVIRNMRFPVNDILELLYSGMSWADILEQHPILEEDDIRAALLFGSMVMKSSAAQYAPAV